MDDGEILNLKIGIPYEYAVAITHGYEFNWWDLTRELFFCRPRQHLAQLWITDLKFPIEIWRIAGKWPNSQREDAFMQIKNIDIKKRQTFIWFTAIL